MPVGKKIDPAVKEKARLLRLHERLPLADIAERLGISVSIVSKAISPGAMDRQGKKEKANAT